MMLAQQKLLRCSLRIAIDDRALLWPGVAWRRSVARRMLAQQKLLRCRLRIPSIIPAPSTMNAGESKGGPRSGYHRIADEGICAIQGPRPC